MNTDLQLCNLASDHPDVYHGTFLKLMSQYFPYQADKTGIGYVPNFVSFCLNKALKIILKVFLDKQLVYNLCNIICINYRVGFEKLLNIHACQTCSLTLFRQPAPNMSKAIIVGTGKSHSF